MRVAALLPREKEEGCHFGEMTEVGLPSTEFRLTLLS
jgi:hypothetical protein